MAFIRTTRYQGRRGERVYHALVKNHRDDGGARQRVLIHLGTASTVEDALREAREQLEALEHSHDELTARRRAGREHSKSDLIRSGQMKGKMNKLKERIKACEAHLASTDGALTPPA